MSSTLTSRFVTCCGLATNTRTLLLKQWTFSSHFNVSSGMVQYARSIHFIQPQRQAQKLGLIGVPFRKGQGRQGVELGPKALRDSGLITSLQNLGHEVNDYGDLEFEDFKDDPKLHNINNWKSISEAGKKICSEVKKVVDAGEVCITLGGDHSLTTGGIYGHTMSQPNIVILWVDAHADINPPAASLTGNMHGMPLSFLVKEVQPYMTREEVFDWVKPCLTTGGIYGHTMSQPNIVILWVDAHADINPPAASLTGNMHGMPLSFLVKEVQPYMTREEVFDWVKPCISAKDIAYIGLRDVDAAERWLIEKLGITCFSMHEVDLYGISTVLKMALSAIDPEGTRPIHFSFDIDSMDPSIAASTGTPAMGGLSYREGMFIAETVANTGRLSALDVVEVNPLLGNEMEQKFTIEVALDIVQAVFGKKRAGTLLPHFSLSQIES